MARTPGSTTKKSGKKGTPLNIRAVKKLWSTIKIDEWFTYLQEIAPDQKWEIASSSIIKGCCPYHDEKTPSFMINFNKRHARCFGACEKFVTDPISLIAKLKNCSVREAQLSLYERFNLKDNFGIGSDQLDRYVQVQEMKKATAIAFQQVMAELIRENPDHLAYCRTALFYLVHVRKLPLNTLSALPVGIYAKPAHVKKYLDQSVHDLYDEYFAYTNKTDNYGAVVLHYNDSPGSISKFKLRIMNKGLMSKYGYQPDQVPEHLRKDMFPHDMKYIADEYAENIGAFGMFHYRRMLGAQDVNAYVTEGEFDALSVMAAQTAEGRPEFMILCSGGKGSTNVGHLREYGIKTIWLVPDHPTQKGDEWALSVLNRKENFTQSSELYPLNVKVFRWPVQLAGFDLDEAVLQNGYSVVSEYLFRQRESYFINSTPWIMGLCDKDVKDICKKAKQELSELSRNEDGYELRKNNIADERQRALTSTISRWFGYIHDPTDKMNYIQHYATEVDIDISQIDSVNDSLYSLDTVNGVTQKIEDQFNLLFSLAYYQKRATGNIHMLWIKQREELIEMNMQDSQILNIIAQYAGKNVVGWLDSILGENDILMEGTEGKGALEVDRTKRRNATHLVKRAMENLIHQALPEDDLHKFAQGIHYLDLPAAAKQDNVMYFVNGKKIFKGKFGENKSLHWEQLDNIVDNNILFETLNQSNKWSFVESVNDLEQSTQVDLKATYHDIRKILDGWKFENHDIIAEYLAAYIMAVPVMRAVGDVNITYVTGEKESGKTTLVNGLLGGGENNTLTPTILEAAVTNFDASTAAMYQMMVGSSRLFVLDEAEFSKNHNTKHDQQNQEMVRMMYSMPQGGVTIRRGGATKEQSVSYFLRMPILMAGINLPADSTFLSRVFVVYTEKDRARRDLGDYIAEHFSDVELERIRNNVTIGLLPYIPEIITRRVKLREELSRAGGEVAHISNRFLSSILTPLAVYDLMGFDANKLYRSILTKYKDRLEAIHSQDSQSGVITAALFSKAVKVTLDDNMQDFVSPRHLIMNHEYTVLNQADCGVYYLPDDGGDMIIIVWRQAKYDVLRHTPYGWQEEQALREQAQHSNFVIPDISKEQDIFIRDVLNLTDVKNASQYTVLDATYLRSMSEELGTKLTSFHEKYVEQKDREDDESLGTKEKGKKNGGSKGKKSIKPATTGTPKARAKTDLSKNINLGKEENFGDDDFEV